jgi:hypothetical protein
MPAPDGDSDPLGVTASDPESTGEPTHRLDATFYPHIMDNIIRLADHDALLAIRCTSKGMRDAAERGLCRHLVYTHKPGTAQPGTELPGSWRVPFTGLVVHRDPEFYWEPGKHFEGLLDDDGDESDDDEYECDSDEFGYETDDPLHYDTDAEGDAGVSDLGSDSGEDDGEEAEPAGATSAPAVHDILEDAPPHDRRLNHARVVDVPFDSRTSYPMNRSLSAMPNVRLVRLLPPTRPVVAPSCCVPGVQHWPDQPAHLPHGTLVKFADADEPGQCVTCEGVVRREVLNILFTPTRAFIVPPVHVMAGHSREVYCLLSPKTTQAPHRYKTRAGLASGAAALNHIAYQVTETWLFNLIRGTSRPKRHVFVGAEAWSSEWLSTSFRPLATSFRPPASGAAEMVEPVAAGDVVDRFRWWLRHCFNNNIHGSRMPEALERFMSSISFISADEFARRIGDDELLPLILSPEPYETDA